MKREELSIKSLLAGLMGIAVVAGGCGDAETAAQESPGPAAMTGSGNSELTGGTQNSAGQAGSGGGTTSAGASQSAGGQGGTPASGGAGVAAGSDSEGIGGSAAGSSAGEGGTGAAPEMGGAANMGGSPSAEAGAAGTDDPMSMGGSPSAEAGATSTEDTAGAASADMAGAPSMEEEEEEEEEEEFTGTCTASEDTGRNASGSGPHDVVIETNSEDGIRCGTIYRPADLGGDEKYPILVWGEGGCSQDGLSNQAAMAEIASWGYFVVADGTPGANNSCQGGQSGDAFLDYVTWSIAENDKPCSAYYQSLAVTKVAADGFSCGGLMAENVAGDPRFTAIGITSSGLMGPNDNLWDSMHAPFKIMNGGSSDVAYQNGLNDYAAISSRGIPIVYFAKTSAGHGGDLGQARGDFNRVNLAWLNWQLKDDEGATGKAFLHGATCEFCTDGGWEYMSANIE